MILIKSWTKPEAVGLRDGMRRLNDQIRTAIIEELFPETDGRDTDGRPVVHFASEFGPDDHSQVDVFVQVEVDLPEVDSSALNTIRSRVATIMGVQSDQALIYIRPSMGLWSTTPAAEAKVS